jgi:hypothetical protein
VIILSWSGGLRMRIVVDYHEERLELELAGDRVVGSFRGPSGIAVADRAAAIAEALGRPREFPPASTLFVSGDRVAIALDSRFPGATTALSVLLPIIRDAVGETGEITVVATPESGSDLARALSAGVGFVVHDPSDRNQLAYLATTQGGRRIYLNRHLTDADVVVPIGEIGFDPLLGHRGPWSVLFPGLSDEETRRNDDGSTPPDILADPAARIDESFEVGWLLGSQFSLGFVPGRFGFAEVVAGLGTSVRDQGIKALERDWNFRAETRAELVIAGIGRPGARSGLEELVAGISLAAGLVQRGGKLVVLSQAEGMLGPSMRRLIAAGEPRQGAKALKAHATDADHTIATLLNQALDWADVYLLSDLDPQVVEDLSMVPLGKASEATRLAAGGQSCIVLSQAELARVVVANDI